MKPSTVLLADDNVELLLMVQRILKPELTLLESVGDGRAVLERVSELDPDVVLLDISMPVMDGLTCARRLKQMNLKTNRGKERDTFGLGWFYTGASNEFGPFAKKAFGIRDGYGWELFYNLGVLPWLRVTPDVQLLRPGLGNLASDWAFVGGLRVKVVL